MGSHALEPSRPFGRGSISASLYIHGQAAREAAAFLVKQGQVAEDSGFDGVTISEHHGGWYEYVPNPLLMSSMILGATQRIWAGPCPMLLSLRPPWLVAEDMAWINARFPGRVGGGFAPGTQSSDVDYVIAGIPMEDRRKIFGRHLPVLAAALRGEATGQLANDPAIQLCKETPIPVLSSVGGPLGAKRAGAAGTGLVPSSSNRIEDLHNFIDPYLAAGGKGPILINRRAWFGKPDARRLESLIEHHATRPLAEAGERHFKADYIVSEDPAEVADGLVDAVVGARGTAVNIKFFYKELQPDEMLRQLADFGKYVVPIFRKKIAEAL